MTMLKLTDDRIKLPPKPVEEGDAHVAFVIPIEELENIDVQLDESPEEDLALFNQKYAQSQAQYTRVCSILISAKREMAYWEEKRSSVKMILRREKNRVLASSPEIQKLRNKELQEAAMHKELEEVSDAIDELTMVISKIQSDIDIIEIRKGVIESASLSLSRQQRVVESMISLNIPVGRPGFKGRRT